MAHGKDRGRTTVVIIGGGISGICAAIELIRQNKCRDIVIIERGVQVGGTWYDNTYPGCCCDVWSHLYSFSFAPNARWSREYPEQSEILDYLIGVAEAWGLYKHIRFNSEVESARWQDVEAAWELKINVTGGKEAEYGAGYSLYADYLISGIGQLNKPYYPDIAGIQQFTGKVMHSARWDWSYNLQDKRVGIVGNGATAAQIIPELVKSCKSLVVFQRTPNWVVPRGDTTISTTRQWMYSYIPGVRSRYRAQLMDRRESFYQAAQVEHTAEKDGIKKDCTDMMKRQIPSDHELRSKLTPDYPPGCKRVVVSDNFYPALNQDHVLLEIRPIECFDANQVILADGAEHELDAVILATGFRTHDFLRPTKVFGRNGREISEVWGGQARAYLGMTVEDMPNFAMLYGPNSNLGHNSIILMIEAQARYISALIQPVLDSARFGMKFTVTPKTAVVDEWNVEVQRRLQEGTVGNSACKSWYKTDDGTVINNWCGTVLEYQTALSSIGWDKYHTEYRSSRDGKLRRSSEHAASIPAFEPICGTQYIGRVKEETSWVSSCLEIGIIAGISMIGIWKVCKVTL